METGWIKLHRKILYNPISSKPHWAWLWIVLLLKANHHKHEFMWNGGIIVVKEGQLLTGRDKLAEASGLSASTVENILKYLEKSKLIKQQKYTKFRLITIVNWSEHQVKSDNKSDNRKDNNSDNSSDTYKNDKKEKNVRSVVAEASTPTPSQEAHAFFSNGVIFTEIRGLLIERINPELVDRELTKFVSYWTEPNKSGTKVRWQMQPTFDVKRRLRTWLDRSGSRGTVMSKGKGLV